MIMCEDFNPRTVCEKSKMERLDNYVHSFVDDDVVHDEFHCLAHRCSKDLSVHNLGKSEFFLT